nr:protein FAR1-RELATED SEQUENCE 5-like [Ipomoea batatas]
MRRKRLGVGDAEAVCKYFAKMQQSDPNFFYVMDVGEDSRLRNSFWADGRSKAAYESFADVITFDTTYVTNKYDMPFSPFVGVNHHGRHPKAIITDQCKAMQNAIEIKEALQSVVYDSLNENEFENGWSLLIDTFDLNENDWLDGLYKERQRWVPTYVKHTFWAGMSTTQQSESMNVFFMDMSTLRQL